MNRLENQHQSFKSIQTETKAFFHGKQWKEALVFFFFFLLAFGFWLLQSLQQEYEIEVRFPIKYKNIPIDIAFNNTIPEIITAKVKDKGSVLLNYTLGRSFVPIEVNMKNSAEKQGTLHISKKQIENDIQKQLIATTTLLHFDPQQLNISFSQRVRKEIPVSFNGEIDYEPGFQLAGEIQITPNTINAYATQVILDNLSTVKTSLIEITKGNKTITKTIQLQHINGVNLEPDAITVTIPIEEFTEKTLDIPVSCLSLPPHYTIRMFPATVKVTCGVPLSRFKDLSKEMFEISIPFKHIEQNLSGTLPVTLSSKPSWVRNVTFVPDKVEFILEHTTNK